MFGPDVERSIYLGICRSTRAFAGEIDGVLMGLFGASPVAAVGGIGSPWMICTTDMEKFPKLIHFYGKALVDITQIEYPTLVNFVDARNTISIGWLKRLGFTIHDPEIMGYEKVPFHKFDMHRMRKDA